MRGTGASNSKRIMAGIMGLVMLVCVLFSAFYIYIEADHDCTGADCFVCASVKQCENILNQVGSAAAQVSIAALIIFLIFAVLFSVQIITQETLISKKVRLNN